MSAARTAILTSCVPFAQAIVRGIAERGCRAGAVFVSVPSWPDCFARSRSRHRTGLALACATRNFAAAWWKACWARLSLGKGTTRIAITGAVNSSQMIADLQAYRPDYLVLAGIGIVSPEVLQTAAEGVVNAHPGLLPWLRGLGVVGCGVLRGLPMGATCHYVEPGIDTGPIIERRLLPIEGSEKTLEEVERKADALCVRMLVDLCADKLLRGERPPGGPQTSRFPLCGWLTASERSTAAEMIRAGVLRARFTEWQQFVVDSGKQRLAAALSWEMPRQ